MDLALHLGGSVDGLMRSMSEAEFQRWALYSQKRSLPFARLEVMLAQLSMLIARTMGGAKNAKVEDFMLQEIADDELPSNVTRLDAARKAFGFAPRNRKVK